MFIRPCEGRISSPFGMRTHPITKKRAMHWGVDLAKSGLVPIKAVADGVVSRVQRDGTFGTYGNVVFVLHTINGKQYETVYAHLANIAVVQGREIKQGANIGAMGTTGGSTGQHLHFEIHVGRWDNKYSNAVDPMMYLPLEVAVKSGDRGLNVGYIQGQLKNAGYSIIVDGDFGQATKKVVELFQRDNKLTVDGIAGPATQKVLASVKPPKPIIEEVDGLPQTQRDDLKALLQRAYDDEVFSVNHTSKVDTMTREQAVDLLISYVARTK